MGFNIRKYFEEHTQFFDGIGSLSLFPNNNYKPYWMNNNLTPQEQDALAIKGDWEKVGSDFKISMDNFKKSLSHKLS